jgi:cyclohexyl-isocyanide hydratase
MAEPFRFGFILFPDLTPLDLVGPLEVLGQLPNSEVHLIWKTHDPVPAGYGLAMLPTTTFDECPPLDLICVPGGSGVNALLTDAETIAFVRRQASGARYVTSVCTGALVLGAAGLLTGKRATTHWMSMEMLRDFDAIPVQERVVVDGNLVTGGGVTAGIDFGFVIAAAIAGENVARAIQLGIEYDPHPPFDSGTPSRAPAPLVEMTRRFAEGRQRERRAHVDKAAAALRGEKTGQS